MATPSYPRSYAEIASAYAANPAYAEADLSLNDFSELGNYFTNSANYDQGTGNWFTNTAKDFAYNKNQWVNENLAPAVNFTGDIGEGLFKFFGADQAAGRQVGEGLISQTVDFLPQLAGYGIGALFPPAASVSVPLGNAITGAMSGATALEASDSYGQAAIMASLPYVAPGISNVGARAGVNTLAKPLAGTAIGKALGFEGGRTVGDQILGKTMADRIAGFVGSEVAIFSATEAASVAVAALEGEAYNPFTKENLLGNLLQTVAMPFSYAELIHPIKMGPAGAAAFDLQKENSLTLADAEAWLAKLEATEVKAKPDPRLTTEIDYLATLKQADTILDPKLRAQAKAAVEKAYQEYRAQPTKTGSDGEQQAGDVMTLFKQALDQTMAKSKGVVEEAPGAGVTIDPVNTPFNLENFMDGKARYILAGTSKIGLSGWEHVSLGGGLESREVFREKEGNYIREIVRTNENGQTPALLKRSYTDSTETEFSLDYETGRYNVEGPREQEFQLPDGTIDQARVQEEFKRQAFPSLSRQLDKLKAMGEPTKLAAMQDQIITANEVRAEYDMEPVHDGTLNGLVDRNMQDGTSMAKGTQMAVSQVKEETKREAPRRENNRGGRKPKPYSNAEVSEKLNEIVEISGDITDKEQLKIAQQGLKLIKLTSEMDRYMRNATAVVYRFLANAKKTAELGRNPEALASLNGLTPRQIRRLGYIISKGEVAIKPEQRMAAWEATQNSVTQMAKRKDTKYVSLSNPAGGKTFYTKAEAEAFRDQNTALGAEVYNTGGKEHTDKATRGPRTWQVRVPQRDTYADIDSYASAEAVEAVESVVAVDLAPIDRVDAEIAGEAVVDSLESLLARADIAWPEGSSIDVKQLRELSKLHPDAVRNRLLQELAPLEPSEVEDMFSGYQTEDPEYFADFGELLNKETERTKDFPKEWSYGERTPEFEAEIDAVIAERGAGWVTPSSDYKPGQEWEAPLGGVVWELKGTGITIGKRDDFRKKGDFFYNVWKQGEIQSTHQSLEDAKAAAEVRVIMDGALERTLPNGQKSKALDALSRWSKDADEALRNYAALFTPSFKNWFGDWEQGGVNLKGVVDSNGEPLVLFRGGTYFKDSVPQSELGFYTQAGSAKLGIFLSDSYLNSETYVKGQRGGKTSFDTDRPYTEQELTQAKALVRSADGRDLQTLLVALTKDLDFDNVLGLLHRSKEGTMSPEDWAFVDNLLPNARATDLDNLLPLGQNDIFAPARWGNPSPAGEVKPFFVRAEKLVEYIDNDSYREVKYRDSIQKAWDDGADAVVIRNTRDPLLNDVYVVKGSEQMKHATKNTGEYGESERFSNWPENTTELYHTTSSQFDGPLKSSKTLGGEGVFFTAQPPKSLDSKARVVSAFADSSKLLEVVNGVYPQEIYTLADSKFKDYGDKGVAMAVADLGYHGEVRKFSNGETKEIVVFDPANVLYAKDKPSADFDGGAGESRKAVEVTSFPELLQRIMIKKGFTAEQVKEAMPYMAAVANVTNMSDVKFGQMLDDAKRGTATIDGPLRMLLLSAKGLDGLSFEDATRSLGFLSGHEIGHLVEHLYKKSMLSEQDMKSFKDFVKWTTEATPEEQRMAFEVVRDGMLPKEYHELEIVQRAFETIGKPEELRAHLMSMWAMSHVHKGDQMANMLLPTPVRRFMQMLTDFAWRSYGAVRGALHRMPNVGTYDARHRAWKLKKLMESARNAEFKAESIIKEFEGIGMVGPEVRQVWDKRVGDLQGQSKELDGFLRMFEEGDKKETVVDTKVKTQASVVPLKKSKIAALFDRMFLQGDQLAAAVPALKNIFYGLHSFNGNTKAMSKRAVGQLTGGVDASGTPYWTAAGQLAWERVTGPKHRVNNKILGDWMRLQNSAPTQRLNAEGELEDSRGKTITFDELAKHDAKLAARLAVLPAKDREAIIEMRERLTESIKQIQVDVAKHFEESSVLNLQSYLALKVPSLYKDAPGLALGMFKALKLNLQGDPQGSQVLLNKIAQAIPDEGAFNGAWDLAKKNFEHWVELQKFFAERPWFFSEIRQGEFLLKWREANGEHGSLAFDTRGQAAEYEKKLHARKATVLPMVQAKRGQPHFDIEPEWMTKVEEIETANKQLIENMTNLTPEEKRQLQATHSYKAEFMKAFAAHDTFNYGSERRQAAGREELDMVNTHIAYINASSRAINRQVLTHALNYGYANPDLKDPTIARYVEQSKHMVNNFMVADTELGTAITTMNAAYFLGLNFSSHMIELMQPLFTFVPELRNQGVGYFKANKMIAAAQQDTAKFFAQHLPNKIKRRFDPSLNEKDDNRLWKSAEEGDLMNWAANHGLISLTHISDIYEADVNSTTDLTSLSHGGSKSLAQKAYSPVKMFAGFSLKIYQQFTEFNARVSLLTGYRLAKEKGLGHAEAREFAADFSRRVTFSGGKANRPELLFGGEGDFRTAGQVAYSLNGYTFGVLAMARRYAMTGYSKKQFPNMTEADRKQARAALRTLVTTQFAGAGLLGMPFVGAAMALVEEYSDEEPVLDMKLALAEFFGEDSEQGGLLGDIVMQGAANAFSNKLLPGAPDFQSRFALGTVMGLNPYSGFSLDQLAGPTGSIVRNIGAGLKALTQEGSFERAVGEWAPVGMKKYLELARNDGALTDARGNMIIDANPEEQFMYAVGFTPQRVKKARELKNLQLRHEEVNRRQDTRFHDDAADLYFRDPQAAAAKIRQRATEDKFYSEQAGMAKIAERVEKKRFANDPAREGTQAGTQGMEPLLRAMNMSSSATEQQRLMLKNDVMRQLGGRPNMSPTSMTRARMIDQAMLANPYLPRAQAAAQVDEQLSRRL